MDNKTLNQLEREGYYHIRVLPVGVAALRDYVNTCDIVFGITGTAYRGRYSYPEPVSARTALNQWNGTGDPSGPWLKYKGPDELRIGPGWATRE
jgi:hypothetical protein